MALTIHCRDDVNELMSLISTLRGFPSDQTKDIYGYDVQLDFNTMDIQWGNADDTPGGDKTQDLAGEQKEDFKNVSDSIENLARTFAKKNSAV